MTAQPLQFRKGEKIMAKITTGQSFNAGDQITSTKLNNIVGTAFLDSDSVTGTTLNLTSGQLKVATNGITDNEIANNSVTYAKIQDVAASSVIGNTTGSTATPGNVAILDEDNMVSNSATSLATQQSIKAYVDSKLVSDEYVSSQGTPTSTSLVANTDTTVGSVTLTLPSGKTWKWVKVVFSTSTQGNQSAFKDCKVKEGATTLSWVKNHNHTNVMSTANDDLAHPSFIFEGVPNTTGSNVTFDVTLQGVSGSVQDQTGNRSLYAVGIASS
jgi:hypothetical protein